MVQQAETFSDLKQKVEKYSLLYTPIKNRPFSHQVHWKTT